MLNCTVSHCSLHNREVSHTQQQVQNHTSQVHQSILTPGTIIPAAVASLVPYTAVHSRCLPQAVRWGMSVCLYNLDYCSRYVLCEQPTKPDCLIGPVVKVSASRVEDPGFQSRWRQDFSGSSHTSAVT